MSIDSVLVYICDGCGLQVIPDYREERPDGWLELGPDDYCGNCRERRP